MEAPQIDSNLENFEQKPLAQPTNDEAEIDPQTDEVGDSQCQIPEVVSEPEVVKPEETEPEVISPPEEPEVISPPKEPEAEFQKLDISNEKAQKVEESEGTEEARQVSKSPIPTVDGGINNVMEKYKLNANKEPTVQKETVEVGNVSSYMNKYTSSTHSKADTPVQEEALKKPGKISSYMNSYLTTAKTKQSPTTPDAKVTITNGSSLRDRMKAYEQRAGNASASRSESALSSAERASNLKSKISNWGKTDDQNIPSLDNDIKEVGSIKNRLSNYQSRAISKGTGDEEEEKEV